MGLARVFCLLLLLFSLGAVKLCATTTRYGLDGARDMEHVTQSGKWRDDATSVGGTTTFHLDAYAALTEHMLGWRVQPDVGFQVYLPITAVDPNNHTLTVAGNYASLGGKGTNFRQPRGSPPDCHSPTLPSATAPPGVETGRGVSGRGKVAGTLAAAVSGESSRCLYAGYRYGSPLAGNGEWVNVGTVSQPVMELQIKNRQKGKNFAGVRAANAPERRNAPQGKLHAAPALRPRADALHQPRPGRQPVLQPLPLRRKQPGAVCSGS